MLHPRIRGARNRFSRIHEGSSRGVAGGEWSYHNRKW
jgi:hypothetical protein